MRDRNRDAKTKQERDAAAAAKRAERAGKRAAREKAMRAAVETAEMQARRRMFWKLVAVVIALGAYALLKGIEGSKRTYEEERGRPVVIVDDEYARDHASEKANTDAERAAERLGSKCSTPLYAKTTPAPAEAKSTPTPADAKAEAVLLRVCAVQGFFPEEGAPPEMKATLANLKDTVVKLKYQNFKDEKAILDRLDEEILADAEFKKKAVLSSEESARKERASKLPGLEQESAMVDPALHKYFHSKLSEQASPGENDDEFKKWLEHESKDLPAADKEEIGKWLPLLAQGKLAPDDDDAKKDSGGKQAGGAASRRAPNKPAAGKTIGRVELLRWRKAIDDQRNIEVGVGALKREIKKIDDDAQAQVSAVYLRLEPKLGDLIEASPGARAKESAVVAFFSPRSVLDEASGVHVVYQTVWLACVVVIVFAIVFLLLLVLRLLPFFERGKESLLEQAGELFKRSEGAGPQLARSLAVSAAALGVGAAVAIAGSGAVSRKTVVSGSYVDSSEQGEGQTPGRAKNGRNVLPGEPGVIEHKVTISPPIAYPSPLSVSGPDSVSIDAASMEEIKGAIAKLTPAAAAGAGLSDAELELRMKKVAGDALADRLGTVDVKRLDSDVKGMDSHVTMLDTRTNDLPTRVAMTELGIDILEWWRTSFASELARNVGDFKDEAAATRAAVLDMRDRQNSGGRGLRTRLRQSVRGDSYLVTQQSYRALWALICPDKQATLCQQGNCSETCSDPDKQVLLTVLKAQIGKPPVGEKDLLKALADYTVRVDAKSGSPSSTDAVLLHVSEKLLAQWKQVILKYTRVGY